MTSTPEQYPTKSEKRRDFIIGVAIFIVSNVALSALNVVPPWLATMIPAVNDAFAYIAMVLLCLPWVVNVGAFLYFFVRRRWVAYGMLAAFGVLLLCTLIAGLIFVGICFYTAGQGK